MNILWSLLETSRHDFVVAGPPSPQLSVRFWLLAKVRTRDT